MHANGVYCMVIVPEQYTLQAEIDIINELELNGLLDIEVLSFARLSHRVFSLSGGSDKTMIDKLGQAMLIRRALSELEDDNEFCASSISRTGFSQKLCDSISEIKAHGITPNALLDIVNSTGDEKNVRLDVLQKVYEKTQAMMEDKFCDGEDMLDLLAQKLPQTQLFKESHIFISGFESMSKKWLSVVSVLISISKGVDVSFCMPYKNSQDDYIFQSEMLSYAAVKSCANQVGVESETIMVEEGKNKSPALLHLSSRLFCPGVYEFGGEANGVEIMRASNKEGEAIKVCMRIIEASKRDDIDFSDMAIILPDMQKDGPIFRRVLEGFNIPCFMDKKQSLIVNPLMRCILSALNCVQMNYRQQDLIELIKTGISGIDVESAYVLENETLKNGWVSYRAKKAVESANSLLGEQNNSNSEIGDHEKSLLLLKTVMDPLMRLEKRIKNGGSAIEQADAIEQYMIEINAAQALDALHEGLAQYEYIDQLEASKQAIDTLLEILDQAKELFGETKLKRLEFGQLLKNAIEQEETGIIPTKQNAVLIGQWERVRLPKLKALFITGASEGSFPPEAEKDALIGDVERRILAENGAVTIPDRKHKWNVALLRIYKAITAADKLVHISVSASDSSGDIVTDAFLYKKILRMFNSNTEQGSAIDSDEIVNTDTAISQLARAMGQGRLNENKWIAIKQLVDIDKDSAIKLDRLKKAIKLAKPQTKVNSSKGLLPKSISVSRLETFSACPFQYFVRYGLRPEKRKVLEWSRMDAGSYLHRAMEIFERKIIEFSQGIKSADSQTIQGIANQALEELDKELQVFSNIADAKMRRWCDKMMETARYCFYYLVEQLQNSDFSLSEIEVDLPKSAAIKMPDGEVRLIGRIDRLDVLNQDDVSYLRLVDYKSSYTSEMSYAQLYHGLCMQLPIYAKAISEEYKRRNKKSEITSMLLSKLDYETINDKSVDQVVFEREKAMKMKGKVVSDVDLLKQMDYTLEPGKDARFIPVGVTKKNELSKKTTSHIEKSQMDALINWSMNIAKRTLQQMQDGFILPNPVKEGNYTKCDYCEYMGICRMDDRMQGFEYRKVKSMKKDEFFERIEKEVGNNE